MTDSKPLNCPCCGSTATVEPHLIEAGCTIGEQTWPDWWTASVNCDSCALQFVGGGDTREEAVEDALEGWNRRATVTDELNAAPWRGTCEYVIEDNMNESEGMGDVWFRCTNCDMTYDYYADDWLMKQDYCPHCGFKIRKAVKR